MKRQEADKQIEENKEQIRALKNVLSETKIKRNLIDKQLEDLKNEIDSLIQKNESIEENAEKPLKDYDEDEDGYIVWLR